MTDTRVACMWAVQDTALQPFFPTTNGYPTDWLGTVLEVAKHAGIWEETEATFCAAMKQTLVTNNKEQKIFKKDCSLLCHLSQKKDETTHHIVSNHSKMTGNKYTKWHNKVAQYIHLNDWGAHAIFFFKVLCAQRTCYVFTKNKI